MFFLDTTVVHLQRMAYSWKLLIHWVFYLFLQDCQFTKTKDDTALRVVYQGNLYLGGCNNCCKRWFITFNGAECSGSQILVKTTTDPGSLRATVTTYTRAKSELESTLETVQDMETPMVTQAGIQCPVWSLKKFLAPSNKLKPWLS